MFAEQEFFLGGGGWGWGLNYEAICIDFQKNYVADKNFYATAFAAVALNINSGTTFFDSKGESFPQKKF